MNLKENGETTTSVPLFTPDTAPVLRSIEPWWLQNFEALRPVRDASGCEAFKSTNDESRYMKNER